MIPSPRFAGHVKIVQPKQLKIDPNALLAQLRADGVEATIVRPINAQAPDSVTLITNGHKATYAALDAEYDRVDGHGGSPHAVTQAAANIDSFVLDDTHTVKLAAKATAIPTSKYTQIRQLLSS